MRKHSIQYNILLRSGQRYMRIFMETSRLFIRPFQESDRSILVSLLMNTFFMEFSSTGGMNYDDANLRFDQILEQGHNNIGKQALGIKNSSEIIGYCGLEPFFIRDKNELELGFRLMPNYRGFGYATEAAKAILSSSKESVFAYVNPLNFKSVNVLTKLGFTLVGEYSHNEKTDHLYKFCA